MLMRVALGLPIDDDYRRAYATRFGDSLAAVPPASPAPQSDALAEIGAFFRKSGRVIIPLTVREILDEQIAHKLA